MPKIQHFIYEERIVLFFKFEPRLLFTTKPVFVQPTNPPPAVNKI